MPPRRPAPFSRTNLVQTIAGGYIPLVLATLVVFLPLLWMLLSSFKQPGEIITMDLKTPSGEREPGELQDGHDHGAVRPVLPEQPDRHDAWAPPSK